FSALCREIEKLPAFFGKQQAKSEGNVIPLNINNTDSNAEGSAKMAPVLAIGGVLAGLLAKRLLIGRSPLAASKKIFSLAAVTTIMGSYP
ncbi:MAG TPA: hypothetical protein DEA44_13735, partial [Firmicutes bacterium]|nr:hypothetical protein [Bacillota bacterium]